MAGLLASRSARHQPIPRNRTGARMPLYSRFSVRESHYTLRDSNHPTRPLLPQADTSHEGNRTPEVTCVTYDPIRIILGKANARNQTKPVQNQTKPRAPKLSPCETKPAPRESRPSPRESRASPHGTRPVCMPEPLQLANSDRRLCQTTRVATSLL